MKRCLLTGATGFLGKNLFRRLMDSGHECYVLVRPGRKLTDLNNIAAGRPFYVHECDIVNEPNHLRQIFTSVIPDRVFHLAAMGTRFDHTPDSMVDVNIRATWNMLQAATGTGFEAFVNAGASQEYGKKPCPTKESDPPTPDTFYGTTKASATLMCQQYAIKTGARITTVRAYSGYGPYEHEHRLIPQLIFRGRECALPPLVHPDSVRDYIYIEDVVDLFIKAAEYEGENPYILNAGTGEMKTLREVVEIARSALGIDAQPQWGSMDDCQFDTTHWVADIAQAKSVLGWSPTHDFDAGFRKAVEWWANRI